MNAIDIIKSELNDTDKLHALIPTERVNGEIHVLTVRVQPARTWDVEEVAHVRTITVDTEDRSAEWSSNGIVVPMNSNLPLALGQALIGTHNVNQDGGEREEPLLKNGLPAGGDELAREILTADLDQEEEPKERPSVGKEGYWKEIGEHEGTEAAPERDPEETVECQSCGETLPVREADRFEVGSTGVEVWVHARGCPEEGETDE